jgi:hypothetical protein
MSTQLVPCRALPVVVAAASRPDCLDFYLNVVAKRYTKSSVILRIGRRFGSGLLHEAKEDILYD